MSTKVEISKKLVLINSASSVAARVLNISVLVWLQQYLLAHITADEYSIYPVLMAVMIFVPLITNILTWGIGRYAVEAYANGDQQRITSIVSTMTPILCGVAIVLITAGGLLAWNVDRILNIAPDRVWDARFMMGVMLVSAAIRLPLAPFGVGLYVRQKFVLQNGIQLGAELLRIGLLLALLLGVSTRVIWIPVAQVSAYMVGLSIKVAISRRLVPSLRFKRGAYNGSVAREISSFGAWNSINQLADTIRSAADPLLLNLLCGAAAAVQVTCFHLGHLAYFHITSLAYMATAPVKPALTAMHATGDKGRLGRAYLRGNRYGMWTALLAAAPLVVFGREFFTLYTEPMYIGAATVMVILLAQYPLSFTSMMLPLIAEARAELRTLTILGIITHAANIGLTIFLVAAMGMGAFGAALSRLIVSVASQPLYMPLGIKLSGVTWRDWLHETVWLGLAPSLAGLPLWLAAKYMIRPDTWVELGTCFVIGAVGYALVLFLFCLQGHERSDLLRVAEKLRLIRRATPAA